MQSFTCVHHTDLRLALAPVMATFAIRLFVPASHPAVTSNACGTGDRLTHWPGFLHRNHSRDATSGRTVRCLLYAGACGAREGNLGVSLVTCGPAPPFHPSFRWLLFTTPPAKVHRHSPYRSSPCPGSGDGYHFHWAFRPSFRPCRYQQRRWDWRPACTLAGISSTESLIECDFQVARPVTT